MKRGFKRKMNLEDSEDENEAETDEEEEEEEEDETPKKGKKPNPLVVTRWKMILPKKGEVRAIIFMWNLGCVFNSFSLKFFPGTKDWGEKIMRNCPHERIVGNLLCLLVLCLFNIRNWNNCIRHCYIMLAGPTWIFEKDWLKNIKESQIAQMQTNLYSEFTTSSFVDFRIPTSSWLVKLC